MPPRSPDPAGPRSLPPDLAASVEAARRNPNLNLGRVILIEELGRGGMGVVWTGWQEDLRRLVAVKVLPAAADAESNTRFVREARVASKLRHPNIVAVHEVGEAGGRLFFTMDIIRGPSLDAVFKGKRPPPKEVAAMARDVARALEAAHKQSVVHRDIKPSNILISEDGRPMVTDFGLAQDASSHTKLTVSGQIMGTPAYMPPEQARGQGGQADPRSDVYSLGAVIYHGLTGRPPVVGGDLRAVIYSVLNDDPMRPSTVVRGIPRDLETICMKCLEKRPDDRYASAADLAADLDRFLAGDAIHARPPGAMERAVRWAKRRPLVVGAAIPAALVVIVLAVVVAQGRSAKRVLFEMKTSVNSALKALEEAPAAVGQQFAGEMLKLSTDAELADTPEKRADIARRAEELRGQIESARAGVAAGTSGTADPVGSKPVNGTGEPVPVVEDSEWRRRKAAILDAIRQERFGDAVAALGEVEKTVPAAEAAEIAAARTQLDAQARLTLGRLVDEATRLAADGKHEEALAKLPDLALWNLPHLSDEVGVARVAIEADRAQAALKNAAPRIATARREVYAALRTWDVAKADAAVASLDKDVPGAGAEVLPVADAARAYLAALTAGADSWKDRTIPYGKEDAKIGGSCPRGIRLMVGPAILEIEFTKLDVKTRQDLAAAGKADPNAIALAWMMAGEPARATWTGDSAPAFQAFATAVEEEARAEALAKKIEDTLKAFLAAGAKKDWVTARGLLMQASAWRKTPAWLAKAAEVAKYEASCVDPRLVELFAVKPVFRDGRHFWSYDLKKPEQLADWAVFSESHKELNAAYGMRHDGGALWIRNAEARFLAPCTGNARVAADIYLTGEGNKLIGVGIGGFGIALWDSITLVVVTPSENRLVTKVIEPIEVGKPYRAEVAIADGRIVCTWAGETIYDGLLGEPHHLTEPGLFASDCSARFLNVEVHLEPRADWTEAYLAATRLTRGATAKGKPVALLNGGHDPKQHGLFRVQENAPWTWNDKEKFVSADATAGPAELHATDGAAVFRNAKLKFQFRANNCHWAEIDLRQTGDANPRFMLPCDRDGDWRSIEITAVETHYTAIVDGSIPLVAGGPLKEVTPGGLRLHFEGGTFDLRNFEITVLSASKEERPFERLSLDPLEKRVKFEGDWTPADVRGPGGMHGSGALELTVPATCDLLIGFDIASETRMHKLRILVDGVELHSREHYMRQSSRDLSMRFRQSRLDAFLDRMPLMLGADTADKSDKRVRIEFTGCETWIACVKLRK